MKEQTHIFSLTNRPTICHVSVVVALLTLTHIMHLLAVHMHLLTV